MILGIDEVGRGPWAGPLVIGAVVLGDARIDGLNDSKKLTKKRREVLEVEILEKAAASGLGWVSAAELDEIGLSAALRLATVRAVKAVDKTKATYDEIIIDGTINFLSETSKGRFVQTIPKADGLIPAVSAASIIAKVARDRFMEAQDDIYPGYSFSAHAGYGTAKHRMAIDTLGVTPLHRLSFGPLKHYSELLAAPDKTVTTKQIGDNAETRVCEYLEAHGHAVIARNWRTRYCEIDIISKKDDILFFTEVKYRESATHGGSATAVTDGKLKRMRFAAELYLSSHTSYFNQEALLAVGLVEGGNLSWLKLDF